MNHTHHHVRREDEKRTASGAGAFHYLDAGERGRSRRLVNAGEDPRVSLGSACAESQSESASPVTVESMARHSRGGRAAAPAGRPARADARSPRRARPPGDGRPAGESSRPGSIDRSASWAPRPDGRTPGARSCPRHGGRLTLRRSVQRTSVVSPSTPRAAAASGRRSMQRGPAKHCCPSTTSRSSTSTSTSRIARAANSELLPAPRSPRMTHAPSPSTLTAPA